MEDDRKGSDDDEDVPLLEAINAVPRLRVRLVNQRALTQTSKPEGPEVVLANGMVSTEVPFIWAR